MAYGEIIRYDSKIDEQLNSVDVSSVCLNFLSIPMCYVI